MRGGQVSGLIVPLITPFTGDGRVDLASLQYLVSKLAELGVDGFFAGSTTGEYTRLEKREVLAIAGVTLESSGGARVYAGATSDSTEESVRLGLALRDLGVDGLVVAPPYFLRPSRDGLIRHFVEIAVRTELPLILYNIPGAVGYELPPDVVAGAAREASNVVAVKATTYDLSYPRRLIRALEEAGVSVFSILPGLDDLILPYLALGASGAIVGLANAIPEVHRRLLDAWNEGNYGVALEEHQRLVDASSIYEAAQSIPCSVKALAIARGARIEPYCRMPDGRVPGEAIFRARQALSRIGVKPWREEG